MANRNQRGVAVGVVLEMVAVAVAAALPADSVQSRVLHALFAACILGVLVAVPLLFVVPFLGMRGFRHDDSGDESEGKPDL